MTLKKSFIITLCFLILVSGIVTLITLLHENEVPVQYPELKGVKVLSHRINNAQTSSESSVYIMFGKDNEKIELKVPLNLYNSLQDNLTVNIKYDKEEMEVKDISFPTLDNTK